MTASLAVFGEKTLRETLCLAANSCTVSCDSLAVLDHPLNVQAVAFILPGFTAAPIAEQVQTLRLEQSFRGPILILTFTPDKLSSDNLHGEVLKLTECKLLQLPFNLQDFCVSISDNNELTEPTLQRLQRRLRTRQAAKLASLIRHDYENKFSLGLAHLLAIEKHQYFNPLDLDKVRREIKQVRFHLVHDKLEAFVSALARLATLVETSTARDEIEQVDTLLQRWKRLCEIFDQVETSESRQLLGNAFELSQQLRSDLKSLLSCVTRIKEESQRSLERGN
jgi:hypothetical protein